MEASLRFVVDIPTKVSWEVVMECSVTTLVTSPAMLPSCSVWGQSDSLTNAPAAAEHPDDVALRVPMRPALIALISAMLLGACGGGNNNVSTTSTQAVSVPLQAAVAIEVDNGDTANFSVSGTIDNVAATGSGTLTDSPPVAATFDGAAVFKTTETITDTVVENGTTTTVTETKQIFTDPQTSAEVGQINDDGSVDVITQVDPIPAAAPLGSSGVLGTGTEYSDTSQQTVVGTVEETYSVGSSTGSSGGSSTGSSGGSSTGTSGGSGTGTSGGSSTGSSGGSGTGTSGGSSTGSSGGSSTGTSG
ncbi:hypothetical protein M3I54_19555, partial [Paraburkholderia sp. CNPSo 3274]|uniref:hypothetical protein n=1 Tax=Paraburkholderia sp. CNPSo 3274 TaxID=2940932 RepID=UPI0020B6474E